MTFNKLTQQDLDFIKELHNTLTSEKRDLEISNKYDISQRTARKWIEELKLSNKSENEPSFIYDAKQYVSGNKRRKIITAAQNATPVKNEFWENLLAYANYIDADIHVIPYRYKNPTPHFSLDNDYWDDKVIPFLDLNRHIISKDFEILSNIKIQPTASMPLSGLSTMTSHRSCVVGHSKLQLECVATPNGTKVMVTTGACTEKNYSDTKAGVRGEFHHCYGFAIVELDDNDNHYVRQVEANNDGSFCDLVYVVKNGSVTKDEVIDAYILGDIHVGSHDKKKIESGLRLFKNADVLVLHDIFDGSSINPHDANNHLLRYKRYSVGALSLDKEIKEVYKFIDGLVSSGIKEKSIYVVPSNHDIFLERYLNSACWKKELHNASAIVSLLGVAFNTDKTIIGALLEDKYNVNSLSFGESLSVQGYELGYHGHVGVNGARGSAQNFRQYASKCVIGHSHSPRRIDGVLQAGTSTKLKLDYTKASPSTWCQSDVIIKNGRAQHILFNKGDFTTLL